MTKQLRQALTTQKKQTKQEKLNLAGTLGIPLGGQRIVEVANRKGYVYVQLRDNPNEVIQAFNNRVAPSYGLPIILEWQNNRYVVMEVDTARYQNNWNTFSPFLPRHGNTHSFDELTGGGGDLVWVYPKQFMPALIIPSGSLGANNVLMSSYVLKNADGTWKYVGNTGTQSLFPYIPATGTQAVMALVYLDSISGNPYLMVGSGSYFANTITGSAQVTPYIPTLSNPNHIPLAAVRLVSGTSSIRWTNIYDTRQFLHVIPTGTGGGGITDAPSDGNTYGRKNAAWVGISGTGGSPLTVQSYTASPSVSNVTTINFSGTYMVDQGGGSVLIAPLERDNVSTIYPTTGTFNAIPNYDYFAALIDGIMIADVNFTIPAGAVGDRIKINITTGSDNYELIIKGAGSITINGGVAATEWSRLFIEGETVELVATSTTNWQVVNDGRIRCKAYMERITSNITTNTAATQTTPDWNSSPTNIGNIADLTNNRMNIRRAGIYSYSAGYMPAVGVSNQNYVRVYVVQNSTNIAHAGNRASTASSTSLVGCTISRKLISCSVGDTLTYQFMTEETDRGLIYNGSAGFEGSNHFTVEEEL